MNLAIVPESDALSLRMNQKTLEKKEIKAKNPIRGKFIKGDL